MCLPVTATRTCVCYGDPHCYQFDADINNKAHEMYMGYSCVYTLVHASDYSPPNYNSVKIDANFERVKPTLQKSFVSDLRINEVSVPYSGLLYLHRYNTMLWFLTL